MKLITFGPFTGEVAVPDVATLQSKGLKVIALERGRQLLKYPDPETQITAGDQIICSGDIKALSEFKRHGKAET
jgi:K+/H+ antiporter YhaU regulatory subunit KhtT